MKARAMSGSGVKVLAVATLSTIVGLTVAYLVLFSGQAPIEGTGEKVMQRQVRVCQEHLACTGDGQRWQGLVRRLNVCTTY